MLKPLPLAIGLLVAPAVLAGGCGSTKTSTSETTTIPATASAGATAGTGARAGTGATAGTPATASKQASKGPAVPGIAIPGISGKQAQHFKEAKEVQNQLVAGHLSQGAAKAKREHIERALEAETHPKLGTEAIRRAVPRHLQYPKEVQERFVTTCIAGKESIASCECILAKFEESKVIEMAEGIAELVDLESRFKIGEEARVKLGEPLPRRIKKHLEECKNARA